jgi:ubiquinone biosynthesis protein UbiJ
MLTEAKKKLVATLQKAVNHYLSLDPESLQRLLKVRNKIVKIELLGIGVDFYLTFTETGLQFDIPASIQENTIKADTIIKGTPLRLLHMALSGEKRQQFFVEDVSIQGNLELGQQVTHLFDQVEIDWEEHFSHLVGDVSAHHLGNIFRKMKAWGKQTRNTLIQDVNEYVHEEINLFPASEALRDFFHDVDSLRMDTDRLEARLKQLQKQVLVKRGEM